MKLYYTNLLIMAYMAKEFEVGYKKEAKNGGFFRVNHRRDLSANKADFKWDSVCSFDILITPSGKWDKRTSPSKSPFYIHEDSLPTFKPKLHDIVEWDGIMFGSVIGENKEDGIIGVQHGSNEDGGCDVYELEPDECTIIQRDGKPFFMPEQEV